MSEDQIEAYVNHVMTNTEVTYVELTWLIKMTLRKESTAHKHLKSAMQATLNDIDYEN